ncbi:MAG TPA: hypothetical protein VN193_17750 [Candidatus Angelobacter sp.]|jgi:hypothetical protein|nr:hypothetical protein [Candidatus Angelobacter sp.]
MLDRLSQADRVSGIGAVAALLSTFLPWYHFDTASSRVSQNAFGTGFLGDVLFFCAAGTILLLLVRHEVIVLRNGLPVREGQAFFGLGCVALAAVVLQMLIGVNGSGAFHSMTLGIVAALFAAGAMLVGGRLQRNAEAPRRLQGHSRR